LRRNRNRSETLFAQKIPAPAHQEPIIKHMGLKLATLSRATTRLAGGKA
jgi:hypothetical protein